MQDIVAHWRDHFDWRQQEAELNRFTQFRAEIDGLGIHFLHERGKGLNPLPTHHFSWLAWVILRDAQNSSSFRVDV